MTHAANHSHPVLQRVTALCLLVSTASGCALTETNASVRSVPGEPVAHLRLTRADASAVTGVFKQDGHAIVGQLAFSADCANESVQSVQRQSVTETHTNRTSAITWAIVGGVMTAVGTGFLVASQSADKRVTCGDGLDSPKDGDGCHSLSGIELESGLTLMGIGLGEALLGGIFLARKPQEERTDLPAQQLTRVTAPVACGNPASLDGLVAAIELPGGGGKWTGRAASDGTVRIDINDKISLPPQANVSVVVDAVPPSLAGLVVPGVSVGTVTLAEGRPVTASHKLASRR